MKNLLVKARAIAKQTKEILAELPAAASYAIHRS